MINIIDDDTKVLYKDYEATYSKQVKLLESNELVKGKKASILSDTMFKAMFMTEERIKYSAKLLSYFIDVDYETIRENIKYDKNEFGKEKESTKGERGDFVAVLNNTRLNIEVNACKNCDTMRRNLGFAFKLYLHNNKRSTENEYTQVIQLNLNNFKFKGLDKSYYISTLNCKEFRLTNDIIIIQIFIPNIVNKCYNEGVHSLSELERFIMAMVEQDVDIAKKYALEDIVMKEYIDEAEEVSFDSGFGQSYDHDIANYNAGFGSGVEEGIEKGIEQGIKKTAIVMLKKKLDINTISECTGLSLNELNNLKEAS